MAALSRLPVLLQLFKVTERTQIQRIDSSRCFSTWCTLLKSRPSTVGVPAWAKAAKKRRAQVLLLDKKKTEQQMEAEIRLADVNANKSDFLTTTRVGVHHPKHRPMSQVSNTRMAITDDQEMFVFYHPNQNYPIEHTKVVNTTDWMTTEDNALHDYRDSLSESEISEIQSLQNKDPKLWTVDVLSHMFKVKPLAIKLAVPLTPEQQLELKVEQDFKSRLSDYEKKEYEKFQNVERRKQLRKKTN